MITTRFRLLLVLPMLCLPFVLHSQEIKSVPGFNIEVVTEDLSFPWSLAFLPNQEMLITERTGTLKRVNRDGETSFITGLPDDIYVQGQGGLLDIRLHPLYPENGWVYLSYSSGNDEENTLKVIRGKIDGTALVQLETIFTVGPSRNTPVHYGARMAFLPDHSVLITSGDGFDYREDAQRINNQMGKILRVNDDGSIPGNNPFFALDKGTLSKSVYSIGHRNSQGLIYDPVRKWIVSHEHGPAGGDEVNIIRPAHNYGWPIITNGRDYSGASISPFKTYPGMEQPFVDWTPSIAPSGLAVVRGAAFPAMQGDYLVGSLKFRKVYWLQMRDNKVAAQVKLFESLNERIRDIRVDKRGLIYLLTDSENGKLVKISPD